MSENSPNLVTLVSIHVIALQMYMSLKNNNEVLFEFYLHRFNMQRRQTATQGPYSETCSNLRSG
jgi:hypothetical protein